MLWKADDFIDALYAEHYRFLLQLCRKRTSYQPMYADLIEECIQDAFLQAYLSREQLQSHPCMRAWLTKTCMNRLIPRAQQLRRHQALEDHSLDDERYAAAGPQVDAIQQHLAREEYRSFHEALLSALSPPEPEIYRAYFEQHRTMRQIADDMGLTENQVRYAIARIRSRAKTVKKSFD